MTADSKDTEIKRAQRKIRTGLVVSNKMDKTVVVTVERKTRHAKYHKIIKRTRKIVAHDEANQCQIGDTVQIMETRPLSKTKNWRVTAVLEKAD